MIYPFIKATITSTVNVPYEWGRTAYDVWENGKISKMFQFGMEKYGVEVLVGEALVLSGCVALSCFFTWRAFQYKEIFENKKHLPVQREVAQCNEVKYLLITAIFFGIVFFGSSLLLTDLSKGIQTK